jgi:protein phosphatase PTC1
VRLTYDHKGSDAQEAKRITDAGGFVMNNRVNGEWTCAQKTDGRALWAISDASTSRAGVLAVTRSLGDAAMKEFVVGSPYTTETSLSEDDTLLIVACDGVSS